MWQIKLSNDPCRGILYTHPSKIIGVINYEDDFADLHLSNGHTVRINGKENVSSFMIRFLAKD